MKKEKWLILLIAFAVLILLSWLVYANFLTKHSTIICDETAYIDNSGDLVNGRYDDTKTGGWNSNVCFQDCAVLCVSLGYKYKSHYSPRGAGDPKQENTCTDWGCGCKCV